MAHAPYYALFAQKGAVGSTHDYKIHKQAADSYSMYTVKTSEECNLIVDGPCQWTILEDSAYQGPVGDTPTIHKMTISDKAASAQDVCTNTELAHICVSIRQFFSHMQLLWNMWCGVYHEDHSHFDINYDICLMLTNENIKFYILKDENAKFYR